MVPILLGVRHWLNRVKEDEKEAAEEAQAGEVPKGSPFTAVTSVASVTFANGGDNLGIYTPLFASADPPKLAAMLCVFYVLLAAWCYAAYVVARHRLVAHTLTHYGHLIVPFVLIGLGVYIIIESGTLTLIGVGS